MHERAQTHSRKYTLTHPHLLDSDTFTYTHHFHFHKHSLLAPTMRGREVILAARGTTAGQSSPVQYVLLTSQGLHRPSPWRPGQSSMWIKVICSSLLPPTWKAHWRWIETALNFNTKAPKIKHWQTHTHTKQNNNSSLVPDEGWLRSKEWFI